MEASMRKLLSVTLVFLVVIPVLANDNEANVKATVEGRYLEWIDAANKKDVTALTNLYDEDAVLMPKEEVPVMGKVAIGEYYKKLVADPHFVPFTLTFIWNSFHVVGDIAITTLVFFRDETRDGKQIRVSGKNMIVWKKQEDDSWKIFRYMYDEIPAKE
jgi:ketosteroid isomerase-like protein